MSIAKRLSLLSCMFLVILALCAGSASAASAGPGWTIDSMAVPTDFSASEGGTYEVEVTNAGSVASEETNPVSGKPTPVVITDTVPAELTVAGASGLACTTTAQVARCEYPGAVAPDQVLHVLISVSVNNPNASGPVTNRVTVSGGGGHEVSTSSTNPISSTPPPFGAAGFNFFIDGVDGSRDTQAGDHPYELTTTIDLNNVLNEDKVGETVPTSVEDLKDVVVDLPLGFAGSTLAAPECALWQLTSRTDLCPSNTVVGHIRTEPQTTEEINSPIWNLVPERGYPAEFGYTDLHEGSHIFYVRVVPTSAGYVLQVTNPDIPQVALSHIVVTFYGNPTEKDGTGNGIPFFTDPTDCSGANLKATVWLDSWQDPGSYNADGTPDLEGDPNWVKMISESPPVTGCDELQFTPELDTQPTTYQADTPSGLELEMKLPQTEAQGVHATPALKDATVSFPDGLTVDPSSGDGLGACSLAQIGWEGKTPFNFDPSPPACPESSKIGSLELETPLIPGVLHGEVYLADQNENPFGSTFATYVVVNDPVTGVVLKIAGELKADPSTGRLTAFFPQNPQLPFSDLKLHFFGGPRAALATPDSCGTFATTSDLEPWSAPGSGPNGAPFGSFLIDEGCVAGFAPSFTAGSTNLQAGAYASFVASFSRQDTDQELAGLTVNLPPGLLADIASVPLCDEADANAGTCPQSTQVGTVQALAGPGPNPLSVAGTAYLTGPYNGGPYGLSVVVPAIAGPFSFGDVVVRQSLRINPITAAVTDVSNPFPTILDPVGSNGQTNGVPIKLRRVDVDIDRPSFTFNPTNCSKLAVSGAVTSTEGEVSNQSTPFQVTNCATLKFTPKLAVSAARQSSKVDGASLFFKISYPHGAQGSQSWFSEAKFDLPKQLPARLTTIQKACLAATFEANPAACPAHSLIGHAVVHTEVLPAPLEGPVYFVSYGGAKFPEAVLVLQGDGVTVDLHGETFIAGKTGVTSATFRNTPDTPFESIEVTIPAGPFSEFGANLPASAKGSFCGQNLKMPTLFKAQNGLEIHEDTPITVTGCAKAAPTRAQKLAAALEACKKKPKGKRASCQAQARKKSGPIKTKKR